MYITKVMREKKLFEKYSIREMIKELAKIKIIKHENMESFISEISKKQKEILKLRNGITKNIVINSKLQFRLERNVGAVCRTVTSGISR